MKIQNIYSGYYSTSNFAPISKNFGSAKDMDLKNIAKNKLYLLPERMQKVVTERIMALCSEIYTWMFIQKF